VGLLSQEGVGEMEDVPLQLVGALTMEVEVEVTWYHDVCMVFLVGPERSEKIRANMALTIAG
jgi:hypothetical protein